MEMSDIWEKVGKAQLTKDVVEYTYKCKVCGQEITAGKPDYPKIKCPNCTRKENYGK